MARAITKVLRDNDLSQKMGRRGREIAQHCNSTENKFVYVGLLDMHVHNGRYLDGNWDEYFKGVKEVDTFLKLLLPLIDRENIRIIKAATWKSTK